MPILTAALYPTGCLPTHKQASPTGLLYHTSCSPGWLEDSSPHLIQQVGQGAVEAVGHLPDIHWPLQHNRRQVGARAVRREHDPVQHRHRASRCAVNFRIYQTLSHSLLYEGLVYTSIKRCMRCRHGTGMCCKRQRRASCVAKTHDLHHVLWILLSYSIGVYIAMCDTQCTRYTWSARRTLRGP